MPSQCAPSGFAVLPVPSQACSPASPSLESRTESIRPDQPPTFTRPMTVIGTRPATMTKNWSTSL